MVQIKATLRNTVRRFSVPDGISFEDIRKKLVEIFPELKGTAPESVTLYYRDPDGDLVVVSSDEELHTAEQLISEDNTLKLLVGVTDNKQAKQEEEEEEDEDELINLLGLVLSPFNNQHLHSHHSVLGGLQSPLDSLFSLGTTSWSDRRRVLKQQEERLRRRREYEERMRKAHLQHVKEMQERAAKIAEEEKKKRQAATTQSKDVEVDGSTKPVVPSFPVGWSADPFGSWKPIVCRGPCGSTTCVWGPWGYTASYGGETSDKDGDKSGEDAKPEEPKPQEEPSEAEVKVDA